MKTYRCLGTLVPLVCLGITICAAETGSASLVEVEKGSVAFNAPTNVPGVEVKGKSGVLSATANVHQDESGLVFEQITASFPVASLTTGMKVRDEHMRKYIFVRPDGQEPDVQFKSARSVCAGARDARDFECDVAGELSVRGVPRPLTVKLHVKQGSSEYHAVGNATLQLSSYGIEQPSQLGVKISNDVSLHLEFTGKSKTALMAWNGGEHR